MKKKRYATLSTLLIMSIKEFNKEHKNCEISRIAPLEGGGNAKYYDYLMVGFDYIENNGEGDKGYAEIRVIL